MKTKITDMTEGSPLRLIISFSLPLMVGNVFQQMYTVVDTMVVGRALGVNALAALGAADWPYWMILGVIRGIAQGFGILMARFFGAKQFENLRSVTGSSAVLAALSAAVLLIVGQLATEPVLRMLNTPPEVMEGALLYLRLMFLGIPVVMIYNLLATILLSLGDGQTPLFAMIVASLSNIGLDLLFVLGFHWGIAGAAVASLIAQSISSVYCFRKIRKIEFMALKRSHFTLEAKMAGRLLALGSPMAAQNAVIAIGGMIITAVVNGYGVAFIGGFTASNKLYGVLEIAASSYGYAMLTFVGQNLGAGKIQRIKTGMGWATVVSLATSAVITAVMLTFGRTIVGAFISGTPAEVAAATEVGYVYLAIMSTCLPVLYVLHVIRSAIQGMGDTVLPMVSGIGELIMRTGGVLILPALLGQYGIFVAEVLAWVGADMILIPSYFVNLRKLKEN